MIGKDVFAKMDAARAVDLKGRCKERSLLQVSVKQLPFQRDNFLPVVGIRAVDLPAEVTTAIHLAVCFLQIQRVPNVIVATVKKYIEKTKVLPIVVIDYLQVIYPLDTRLSTKDAVDMNVRALKNLQKDHNLVVILVSSLNRANYLTPIDFESFKESGGIEYTADVIWGLQLKVMNDEIFDKDKGLKAKREAVRDAKKEKPRKIEFVCLKNRYGESSYSCYFDYYPQYDYFVPSRSFGIDDDDDDDDRL